MYKSGTPFTVPLLRLLHDQTGNQEQVLTFYGRIVISQKQVFNTF